jgi:hypothetical protein
MKKLTTLLVAMLFTAGMAFAQSNNATVDQQGVSNDTQVDQQGTLNSADVTQVNGFNEVVLNQTSNTSGSSTAVIEQIVTGSATSSRGQDVLLDQTGLNNADIYQRGAGNKVLNYDGTSAAVQTSTTTLNTLDIDQRTGWSEAFFEQYVGGNSATVDQSGGNNFVASILQNSGDNTASVVQTGGNSTADVQQLGTGGHTATVNQGANFQDGAFEVDIIQDGLGNNSLVNQNNGDGSYGNIFQNGDMNMSTLTQNGLNQTADIDQIGNNNMATVTQSN